MRTFSITGFEKLEISGEHCYSSESRPREQASVCVRFTEVCSSCEVELLESNYIHGKASQIFILGDAMTALDHMLETVFLLMSHEETAKVSVFLPGKIVNVTDSVTVTCIAHLSIIENSKVVYELSSGEKLGIAVKYKNKGVTLYKEKILHRQIVAFKLFSDAVKWLCMIDPQDQEAEVAEAILVKVQCYNNIALFHLQQHNYQLCIAATTTVLSLDDRNVKALYRRAVANTELQNYEIADEDLKAALTLDPKNTSVKKQQEVIKKKQKMLTDKYAVAMKKLFS